MAKKIRTSVTAFFFLFFTFLLAQPSPQAADKLELPALKKNEVILYHKGFTISYNQHHYQANWVAYHLSKTNASAKIERKGAFRPDPRFPQCAGNQDYSKSGYDKGHLFPAANSWTPEIMTESFYYTNVSPQDPSFNRGIWKKLETLEREWAIQYDDIYVVTGPVLKSTRGTIGKGVSVPVYYYKVILDYSLPEYKGIGFLLKNEKEDASRLSHYAISIDSVESVTGIDFFPALPDELETTLESKADITKWNWTVKKEE
ncbi:MAG: DNA/RNA non-specific endonuclease [Bacteroidetes bacterium]|nr:DNA/RNA non-specific endonuclease [Bacteroidota bacterium]